MANNIELEQIHKHSINNIWQIMLQKIAFFMQQTCTKGNTCEDIGMADSNALLLACSAMYACEKLGPPECLLNLSHAIVYACEAEKSNSVYLAMHKAMEDAINAKDDKIPNNLKNHPSTNKDETKNYLYPHDFGGYVKQQYLPNSLKDRVYYVTSNNGKEKGMVRKKSKFFKLNKNK